MACYSPLPAQKKLDGTIKVYPRNPNVVYAPDNFFVPCGQCIGCRLEKSRQWAIRITHEASLYEHNQFITLTYNDQNLPKDQSLDVRDFQLFMKRLRKTTNEKIRFFHCGEYGETTKRPHYHAIIFNLELKDKVPLKKINDNIIYQSDILEKCWGKGYTSTANVTFDSAAYVARYAMKKVTGKAAFNHYTDYDKETGEIFAERRPEYTTMSRRPGIGKQWLKKYQSDVFPHDEVYINGHLIKPPKYYLNQYEITNPKEWEELKKQREILARKNLYENTHERLLTRKKVKEEKLKLLTRKLD